MLQQPTSDISLLAATETLHSRSSQFCLLIRRLEPNDRAALAAHLIGLPPEDRRTRFSGQPRDEAIRRHCDDLDLEETVCFAAFDTAGAAVGAALGFPCGVSAGHCHWFAEIAVSVAPEHRRGGLGAALVTRVCDAVSALGANAAVFEFDPSNVAMRGLSAIWADWRGHSRTPARSRCPRSTEHGSFQCWRRVLPHAPLSPAFGTAWAILTPALRSLRVAYLEGKQGLHRVRQEDLRMDADAQGPKGTVYRFDRFTLDLIRGALLAAGGTEVALRPKAFALLRQMVENAGRLINRDEIMAAIWPGVVVTDDR